LPWFGNLDELFTRVCIPGARYQVLGPHGSGKSSLLVHLVDLARRRGMTVQLSRGSAGSPPFSRAALVLVDEVEELGALRFGVLSAVTRVTRASLVVSTHADLGLPTLITCRVDVVTAKRVVARLLSGRTELPMPADEELADALARHGHNLREVLFELYDRAENSDRSGASIKVIDAR